METPADDLKRILYVTDLSENARYAFAYAVSQANHYGASITLLHVLGNTARRVLRQTNVPVLVLNLPKS